MENANRKSRRAAVAKGDKVSETAQTNAALPNFTKMEEFGRNARLGETSRLDAAWYVLEEAERGAANPSNTDLYVEAFIRGTGKVWAKRSKETLEANMRHMAHPRVVVANSGGKLRNAFDAYIAADSVPLKDGYGGFSRSQTGKDEFGCLHTFCRYLSTLPDNVEPMLGVADISKRLVATKVEAAEVKRVADEAKQAKDAADPEKQKVLDADRRKSFAETFAKIKPAELTKEQTALIDKFNKAFNVTLA